jgi:hypothetical protein
MNPRSTLVTAALLTAAAVPAWGQTAGPAAGPATEGAQGAASIPDFYGPWARVSFPGFEPPLAGPGPVTNRNRAPNGASSLYGYVGDYTNPILKPQAAEIVKKRGEIEAGGAHAPSPRTQCWPGGVPFAFINVGMQMFQQPDKITIFYSENREVRRVRMNEPHAAHVTPSWYGDSVGHYQGDTLVIDTVGVKIGPFAMLDSYGTPHSAALHVVERYRLLDYEAAKEGIERDAHENQIALGTRDETVRGKYLQLKFTVEDEGVFTTPWSATVTYGRPLIEWPEFVCAENNQWFPGTEGAIPTANKPDF